MIVLDESSTPPLQPASSLLYERSSSSSVPCTPPTPGQLARFRLTEALVDAASARDALAAAEDCGPQLDTEMASRAVARVGLLVIGPAQGALASSCTWRSLLARVVESCKADRVDPECLCAVLWALAACGGQAQAVVAQLLDVLHPQLVRRAGSMDDDDIDPQTSELVGAVWAYALIGRHACPVRWLESLASKMRAWRGTANLRTSAVRSLAVGLPHCVVHSWAQGAWRGQQTQGAQLAAHAVWGLSSQRQQPGPEALAAAEDRVSRNLHELRLEVCPALLEAAAAGLAACSSRACARRRSVLTQCCLLGCLPGPGVACLNLAGAGGRLPAGPGQPAAGPPAAPRHPARCGLCCAGACAGAGPGHHRQPAAGAGRPQSPARGPVGPAGGARRPHPAQACGVGCSGLWCCMHLLRPATAAQGRAC